MDKYTIPLQKTQSDAQQPTTECQGTDRFAEILGAIQASRSALEEQIWGVKSEVALVRQDLHNVIDRVTEAEGRVTELEDAVKELQATVQRLSDTTGAIEYRAEDAENWARRNNLHFIGSLEGVEGARADAFLEDWIRT